MGRLAGLTVVAVIVCHGVVATGAVELPRHSPRARVSQQIGLTEISVDYFSPSVRGRSIWGVAVPFGRVWRSEENPGWRITFSKPVAFGDQDIPAGSYSLLVIPSSTGEWTAVVNRDAGLIDGGVAYRPSLDVAQIKVTPQPAPARERLTFLFSDFGDETASLDLEWEKLRLSLPIRVQTREQVLASIRALDGTWRAYADVARHLGESKHDYATALAYIDRSIALQPNDYNNGIKRALLAAQAGSKRDRRRGSMPGKGRLGDQTLAVVNEDARFPADAAVVTPEHGQREELPEAKLPPAARPGAAIASGLVTPPAAGRTGSAHAHDRGPTAASAERPSDVAAVIKSGTPDIEGCHQRALRRDPTLPEGRITVSVIVGATGLARSVNVDATPRLRGLAPCISDAVMRWVFPPAATEYATEFPLTFQQRP